MEIASAYSAKIPHEFGIEFGKKSRTKQAHQDETNINLIMAKYVKTGIIEHSNKFSAEYGFATSEDFLSSTVIVQKAQQMFDELPSKARNKFHNKPEEFLEFVQNPENEGELFDLGLSDIPPIEAEDGVPPILETLPIPPTPPEA